MSVTGIQGQLLEVTVVGCNKLKDTEWISRQDPYVCLEYASTKFRTRTCTDGGKNPTFQEKFVFTLIEGLREINVIVWNSNTLTFDDYIGSGRVQLQKVLAQGFDDTAWPLQSKSGRHAGEVRLILHYPNANKSAHGQHGFAPAAPPYAPSAPAMPYTSQPSPATTYPLSGGYPPPPTAYHGYPNPPTAYPPSPSPYPLPPQSTSYPPQPGAYPPPPHSSAYPPPPSMYPPPPSVYPPAPYPPAPYPPPQASPFYPGSYPGSYPPY